MTIKEWLEGLADSNQSTEQDSRMMQNLLRRIYPECIVTSGIVYVEGRGTLEYPPMSIHTMANAILIGEKVSTK